MDTNEPAASRSSRRRLLAALMFFQGGCGLAYEYTFSVVASTLLGNSIQQWAIIIALMLFAMGLGAELQKFVRSERLAEGLVGSQMLLALAGGFGPLFLVWIFSFAPSHFALVHYGTVLLVGLLIGFEIPLVIRMNEEFTDEVRINLAAILRMDYIGALAGALLWVFVLLRWLVVTEIAVVLGLTTTVGALVCLIAYRARVRRPAGWALAGIALLGVLGFSLGRIEHWTLRAEQALYYDRVILAESTPYQHIVLTEGRDGRISCYINGKLQFASTDEYIYHENLVHPALRIAPSRQRVLILGGGDGLALREVLKYPDVEYVELVDIDPAMTDLARDHPVFRRLNADSLRSDRVRAQATTAVTPGEVEILEIPSAREHFVEVPALPTEVRVRNLDAANFVREAEGTFDVAILDFPDPSSPDLAKLYSTVFYRGLRERLSPGAIVVQQATSPFHAKEAFLCIGRTYAAAGYTMVPYHDNVPSFGEWGWWIGGRQEEWSEARLRSRLAEPQPFEVPVRYLTPDLQAASLSFGRGALASPTTAITTQTSPYVFQAYLHGWR